MTNTNTRPPVGRRFLFACACLLAAPPILLFITTPMDAGHQALLGLASVLVMALVNRFRPDSRRVSLWLVALSLIVSSRYIWWRATSTLHFESVPEAVLGYGLFLAELYALVILLLGYLQTLWPLERKLVPLPEDTHLWPTVDVYIPTYNESLDVVSDTVLSAQNLDYPAEKMRIYILDDGRRDSFEAFAKSAGVGYITREDNQHAKAGNLNNALGQTDGELICVFDCDHIPTAGFLQATVGGFVEDAKLAMVQTPHYFYSQDPFERNLGVGEELPREGELFYGPVQKGNDFWNATFFCGSCAVIRRQALDDTDGFAVETVTEDAHTALRFQRKGWRTAFVSLPLAAGLATERLSLHIGQRARWARGMTQILRMDNPLFGRGLSLAQRLCYLNAMLHFQFALPRVVFITAPLAYLLLGQNIIASSASMIFAYALPHLFHAIWTNSRLNGRFRYTFWGEIYESVLCFHLVKPTLVTLWDPKKGSFNVTEKGGLLENSFFDISAVRPHLVVAFLLALGLGSGLVRFYWNEFYAIERDVMLLNVFWAGFSLITLLAAIAAAREQRQVRTNVRVPLVLPASIYLADGHVLKTRTLDVSLGGVRLANPVDETFDGEVEDVEIRLDDLSVVLPARLVSAEGKDLRLQFGLMNLGQQRQMLRIVMGRYDAWLPDHAHPKDRPLHSFRIVLRVVILMFFGRWLARGRKEREIDETMRANRLWHRFMPLAVLVLLVLLALLAVRPALAADSVGAGHVGAGPARERPATPAGRTPETATKDGATLETRTDQQTLTFRQLGQVDGLTLAGAQSQAGLGFSVGRDEVVTEAEMYLKLTYGEEILPGTGRLVVEINGARVQTLALDRDATEAEFRLPVNPALLVTNNRINFRLVGLADRACPNPLDKRVWLTVAPSSAINYQADRLPLASDLEMLPEPFFDLTSQSRLDLHLVLPDEPDSDVLRAAAITASWFGAQARYRGTRFSLHDNELPAAHAIVLSTDANPVSGLSSEAGSHLSVIDNPADPFFKLLVLHGTDGADLVRAARYLTLRSAQLRGRRQPVQDVDSPVRAAHDAPRWVSTEMPVELGSLVSGDQLRTQGLYPGVIDVGFRASPDLFLWPGETVPLRVRYRFAEGRWLDNDKSRLDVALNGQFLKSLPPPRLDWWGNIKRELGAGDTRQQEAVIPVPPDLIHGENRLTFYFNLHYTLEEECDPVLPGDVVNQVYPASTLDLTHTRHLAVMPSLSAFVAAGYPFSDRADLSRTGLVLPATPDLATLTTALDLMARIGAASGYPALGVEVSLGVDGLQRLRDRDLLAVLPMADPAFSRLLRGSAFARDNGELRVRPPTPVERLRRLALGDWFLEHEQAAIALAGQRDPRVLMSMPSPLNEDRWQVLVAAEDSARLPAMADALGDSDITSRVRGDFLLLDADQPRAFRVNPQRLSGDVNWLTQFRWGFGKRPLLLFFLVCVIFALLVALLVPLLKWRQARRLGE
ncbi:MAG: UDP-forming cellulose synthase catalytic subunit [Alcanivorax sp.]|nr:UDP-forming cellulose synthase catalytic subunit [Alcanivorax sp.]